MNEAQNEKMLQNDIEPGKIDKISEPAEATENEENSPIIDLQIKKEFVRKKKTIGSYIKKFFILCFGAFLYAVGLETFLIPNNIIDGGVVGISIMAAALTPISFSVYLVLINIPFLYLAKPFEIKENIKGKRNPLSK